MTTSYAGPEVTADTRGLICAFQLNEGVAADRIGWDDLDDVAVPRSGTLWLHFSLTDTRAQSWIGDAQFIPEAARNLLLSTDQQTRLEKVGDGLVAILADLHHDFATDPDSVGTLRVYLDNRCVITGRRTPLRAVDRLRIEVEAGEHVAGPIALLAHLMDHIADTVATLLQGLVETIDSVEDAIIADRGSRRAEELIAVRRTILRLHRHPRIARQAILALLPRLPAWCNDADAASLRQISKRLGAQAQDVELVQDRARLVQEEIAHRLQEATNRNLYFLSIVTTIFLPITLITGVFGMNVGGLPWLDTAGGFWLVILLMLATVAVALLILRWRRIL